MKAGAAEWVIAALVGILVFTVLTVSTVSADWGYRQQQPEEDPADSNNSVVLGKVFLGLPGGPEHGEGINRVSANYLLPFEIVSVHLLVVLVGAAYLARAKRRRGGL
jgi:NADH:ubiquinone oxidoreductase subunit 6 (subunit J)